jgi:hypothetical protein
MATKDTLQDKIASCKTAYDFIALAKEALAAPADEAFAKEMLSKAEALCSMPLEYIALGDVYAIDLNDPDSAEEFYEEAEDNCFEPAETCALARSYAIGMKDKAKAAELLKDAAKSAKKPAELLAISKLAGSELGDEALAKEMLGKVAAQCKTVEDYTKIATTLINEVKDFESAKVLMKKAENSVDGVEDTVAFAEALVTLFDDKKWAASLLEDVEDDAKFTSEFVRLAIGFKKFADDEDKAKEMLDSAQQFASKGMDYIDLAKGVWNLFRDKAASAKHFEKALPDLPDRNSIVDNAKLVVEYLGDLAVAEKYMLRAEEKCLSSKDLVELSATTVDLFKNTKLAVDILSRSEAKFDALQDLMTIAAGVITVTNDKAVAERVYRKAFGAVNSFSGYIDLLNETGPKLENMAFALEILEKCYGSCFASGEYITVAEKAISIVGNKELCEKAALSAEDSVVNLKEMETVCDFVKKNFPENTEWNERVDTKLAKRRDKQTVYDDFQKKENSAKTPKELITLAYAIDKDLEDKYYIRKILKKAESLLADYVFAVTNYRKLVVAINELLGDKNWIVEVYDFMAASKLQFPFELEAIAAGALEDIADKQVSITKLTAYVAQFEKQIDAKGKAAAGDYLKLALIVKNYLQNGEKANELLKKAETVFNSCYDAAAAAVAAFKLGAQSQGESFIARAFDMSDSVKDSISTAAYLKNEGAPVEAFRSQFKSSCKKGGAFIDKLAAAEALIDIFNDKSAAIKYFDDIASQVKSDAEKELLAESRNAKVERKYW